MPYTGDWLLSPQEKAQRLRDSAFGGDTFLTGADPFDRMYQPDPTPTDPSVYGNLPGEVSRDEAARKAAQRRQILAALAGGLSAPRQGGGFLGGLAAGFSGAVQGSMAYADKTQEIERQRARDEAANRQRQEADINAQLTRQREWAQLMETTRHNKATEEAKPPRQMSELEYFLKDPAGYRTFKQTGFKAEDPKKQDRASLNDLNKLSDNFRQDKDVQNYTVVRDNYKRIHGQSKLGTGQGDLSVIFSFMRVLDPQSVVRETEFKNAEQAVGQLQRMYNFPNKWVKGNRLTPEGRAGFVQAAKDIYETQRKTYKTKADIYTRQAKAFGVDPTLIVPDYGDEEDKPDPLGIR